MNSFVHLHNHTSYSLLDGAAKIKDLVARAVAEGQPGLAITDHGNLYGLIEFYKACNSAGIKPILGLETYFSEDQSDRVTRRKDDSGVADKRYFHLTLLSENNTGYRNLIKLSSDAFLNGYYYKPRCFAPGQEVMTSKGFRVIEDIVVGDLVLTHNGNFSPVTKTMVSHVENETLYGVKLNKSYSRTVWMTGEHPVLIRNRQGVLDWVEAKDIVAGRPSNKESVDNWNSWVCLPKHTIRNSITSLNVEGYVSWDRDGVRFKKVFDRKLRKQSAHYSDCKQEIDLDYDFGYFLGLYVAEGSSSKELAFHLHKKEVEYIDFLVNFCQKLTGKSPTVDRRIDRPRYNGVSVRCYSVLLSELCASLCGKGANNKHLPDFTFDAPLDFQRGLFEGVLAGDGSIKSSVTVFTQTSRQLAWQMRQLAALFTDSFACIAEWDDDNSDHAIQYRSNYSCGSNELSHRITLSDDRFVYKPVSEVDTQIYTGPVYNIEVNGDHSYVTDFAVHNCDWNKLERFSDGLIATTGCLGGPVLQHLMHGRFDEALATTARLQDIFGKDNLYVELQDHGLIEQVRTNPQLIEIARQLGAPLVATNDIHYTNPEDAEVHDILLCCQVGAKKSDENRFKFESDQHFLKSSAEMRSLFQNVEGACDNTLIICERSDVSIDMDTLHLPVFDVPEGFTDPSAYLTHLTHKGLKDRYPDASQEVLDRVAYELNTVDGLGLSSYFLIVWDLQQFAAREGIRCGPGRGSAAGSIISYCLGITQVDPIRHNLIFERFLNPERIALPDIDLDYDTRYRDRMINYTIEKYGRENVAQIITFSEIKARSAVRDAGRVLGYEPQIADKISKAMPDLLMGEATPLAACLELDPRYEAGYQRAEELRVLYNSDPDARKIIDTAKGLEGLFRQDGIGAAAVVITPEPIQNLVPVQRKSQNDPIVTQYEKNVIEDLGLLKMDYLGLRNLDVISDTLDLIGYDPWDDEKFNDGKTYELLRQGHTVGVFQLESAPMRQLLKRLKPNSIDDIAAVVALYRPGPMGSNMHNDYADRKNGRQAVEIFHQDAEEILSRTYGLCIAHDQEVATVNGPVPVEDLEIGEMVFGFAGQHGFVTNKVFTGTKQVYEVRANGRTVRCSGEHKFLTPDGYIEAKDLDGRLVAIPNNGYATKGDLHEPEFARVLAALIAEGDLRNGSLNICNNDKEFRERFIEDVENLYPELNCKEYFNTRAWYVSVTQKNRHNGGYHCPHSLREWLRLAQLDKCDSYSKFIPDIVWDWDDDTRFEFIANYINGDGHVGDSLVNIRTVSKAVAEGLHDLLISLGIFSRIGQDSDGYTIFIQDNEKFNNHILPRLITRKQIRQESVSERGLAKFSVRDSWLKSELSQRDYANKTGVARSLIVSGGDICKRSVAEKCGWESEHYWVRASVVATNSFVDMYDIEVGADHHSFIVGGLVVHNCIYQEQTMQIAQRFAGYSMAEADGLRKIIGKKLIDKMADERDRFVQGCCDQGYGEDLGNKLFSMIEKFASYGFNASHAYSYAYISYQTAYLKANYPAEYMAALCTSLMSNTDRCAFYLEEAREMGLKIYPPDVNTSSEGFTVESDGLRVGLGILKNFGPEAAKGLLRERENGSFTSIMDLAARANPNSQAFTSLSLSGALNKFGTRRGVASVIPEVLKAARSKKKKANQGALFDSDDLYDFDIPEAEFSWSELLRKEHEVMGIFLSGHPLDNFEDYKTDQKIHDTEFISSETITEILVWVSDVVVKRTRAGKKMAILKVADTTGAAEVLVFPKSFEKAPDVANLTDSIVLLKMRVSRRDEDRTLAYVAHEVVGSLIEEIPVDTEDVRLYLPQGFAQDEQAISKLKGLILGHYGKDPISLYVSRSSYLNLGQEFTVQPSTEFYDGVKLLFKEFASR